MLYFSLPDFYERFQLNMFMRDLSKFNPDYFKAEISFVCQDGALPYCSWSGGKNSCVGNGAYYSDFISCQQMGAIPYRINFANVLLEEDDYADNMAHAVLKAFDCGSNIIEISSIPLMEKISEKYPEYRFSFSRNADLITEFTPELIEGILSIDNMLTVGIPEKYSYNIEWLKQLPKKALCEIVVNPRCPATCKNCDVCLLKEHQNQLNYSGQQQISSCEKRLNWFNSNNIISLEQINKVYKKMGFIRFAIIGDYSLDDDTLMKFYIDYFIKPEHQLEVYMLYQERSNKWKQQVAQQQGGV